MWGIRCFLLIYLCHGLVKWGEATISLTIFACADTDLQSSIFGGFWSLKSVLNSNGKYLLKKRFFLMESFIFWSYRGNPSQKWIRFSLLIGFKNNHFGWHLQIMADYSIDFPLYSPIERQSNFYFFSRVRLASIDFDRLRYDRYRLALNQKVMDIFLQDWNKGWITYCIDFPKISVVSTLS